MHFNWTITGDGLATIAAGIIAFCAVWWQVRSSVRNLQKQLDAEKTAREQEARGQQMALAKALHVEIDAWAKYRLPRIDSALRHLEAFDPARYALPRYTWPEQNLCTIYEGSAGKLGILSVRTVADVVSFYVAAQEYESKWRETCALIERAHGGDPMAEESAKSKLKVLNDPKTMPELRKCVNEALKALEDEFGPAADEESKDAQTY